MIILYLNCIFAGNITMDVILGHHCSETIPSKPMFCSILIGKQDSIWYILPRITHCSKVSKLSPIEAIIDGCTISASVLLLKGTNLILHLPGFFFPV